MKAVISVLGKDTVGILAKVAAMCSDNNTNVMDVSQTVLQDMFAMTMLVDITDCKIPFEDFADKLKALGEEMGLQVHAMHEDIFNSMHRI